MIKTLLHLNKNINIYLIVTMLTKYIHSEVILLPHGSMKIKEIYLKNRERMRCDETIIIKKYDENIYIETEDKIRTKDKERYFTEQILDILIDQIFFSDTKQIIINGITIDKSEKASELASINRLKKKMCQKPVREKLKEFLEKISMDIHIKPLTLKSNQCDTYIIINKYDEKKIIVTEDKTRMEIEERYLTYPIPKINLFPFH